MTMKHVLGLSFGVAFAAIAGCSSLQACQSPECASDAKITAEIRGRLHDIASLSPGSVTVQTLNGVVYLYGPVDSNVERVAALNAAQVPGVKEVYDDTYQRNN